MLLKNDHVVFVFLFNESIQLAAMQLGGVVETVLKASQSAPFLFTESDESHRPSRAHGSPSKGHGLRTTLPLVATCF